ncbi:hypothetical protein Tco_1336083 [Tanacetum coccineum]
MTAVVRRRDCCYFAAAVTLTAVLDFVQAHWAYTSGWGGYGPEPKGAIPESSGAVVPAKFDMHIHTSTLTSKELEDAIEEYGIPLDLHPQLPPPDLTMDKLPSSFIGIYGNWFSFENKVGGRARKCFKEVTSSLRGWKKKFFLVDRRAVPEAMPWRHADSDLRDNFPTNYRESDAARLSAVLVPLRPPPRHLLYLCGLTTLCRNPGLSYNIKNAKGKVITMDDFLMLPEWTGTTVSRGDPINESQRPKKRTVEPLKVGEPLPELSFRQKGLEVSNPDVVAAREKNELKNLAKAQAKRDREGVEEMIKKKKRVRKDLEPQGSGSVGTHLSATPSDSVALVTSLEALNDVNEVCYYGRSCSYRDGRFPSSSLYDRGAGKKINSFPKEVIADFLPDHDVLPSPGENAHRGLSDVYPSHSADAEDSGAGGLDSKFIPDWGLRDDLRIYREKELLGTQLAAAEDRVHFLEEGNVQLTAGMAKKEMTRHRLIKEFVPDVVRKLHMSVKYLQSVAAPVRLSFTIGWLSGLSLGRTEDEIEKFIAQSNNLDIEGSKTWKVKHRELFNKSYPFVQKVSDSYRLPFESLMRLILDAPDFSTTVGTETSSKGTDAGDAATNS